MRRKQRPRDSPRGGSFYKLLAATLCFLLMLLSSQYLLVESGGGDTSNRNATMWGANELPNVARLAREKGKQLLEAYRSANLSQALGYAKKGVCRCQYACVWSAGRLALPKIVMFLPGIVIDYYARHSGACEKQGFVSGPPRFWNCKKKLPTFWNIDHFGQN